MALPLPVPLCLPCLLSPAPWPLVAVSPEAPQAALAAGEWLLLLHPALMILFVYPVVGATIRLGILVRERRLDLNPIAATVPVEHVDHGRWVATGAVVAALLALVANLVHRGALAAPSAGMVALAILALAGCLALWRVRPAGVRAACALLSWGALAVLVAQPPLWFGGVRPWSRPWTSHAAAGLLLIALLLVAMAAAPEIRNRPSWRRGHMAGALLAALLLAMQAISGSRDLLLARLGAG
ncbi:MAG: DUF4079 family protein [Synechococcaceae cyanobacterium]|nr:DUF4079 family protein [Synechococcaceae cyanobacterium]